MRKYLRDLLRHGNSKPGRLSRPGQSTGGDISGLYDQPSSSFLGKLPAELRAQVYFELLGGQRVHVKIMPITRRAIGDNSAKWKHQICQLHGVPFELVDDYYQCYYQCLSKDVQHLDIGILLACRKTHDESIIILYKTTTFILHAAMPSMSLPAYIRSFQCQTPRTWDLIASLELPWSLPWADRPHCSAGAEQRYRGLWELLGRVPGLRQLRVAMFMPDCERDPKRRDEFRALYLGPVEELRGLKMCEIAAPRSYCVNFGIGNGELFCNEGGEGSYRLIWMLDANARSEAIDLLRRM